MIARLKKAGHLLSFIAFLALCVYGYNVFSKSKYCKPRYDIMEIDAQHVVVKKRFLGNSEKIIYYR